MQTRAENRGWHRLAVMSLLGLAACQVPATDSRAPMRAAPSADAASTTASDDLPADRRIAVITSKGLQHVTAEELSALTSENPPASQPMPALPTPATDNHDSPYVLKLTQDEYESAFEVHAKDQPQPSLTYQIEPGILRLTFARERSESEQIQDLTAMLKELMQELQAAFSPSALVVDIDYATYPVAMERLVKHALHDPSYLALSARLRHNDAAALPLLQRYVRDVLQTHSMIVELEQLMSAFAMRLHASRVEHCRTLPSHPELALGNWLRERHLATNRTVPIGCHVTFALLPAQPVEPFIKKASPPGTERDAGVAAQ